MDKKTGVIRVSANAVDTSGATGTLRWGSDPGAAVVDFFNAASCIDKGKAKKCELANPTTLASKTPPAGCTVHLAADGPFACQVWIGGCTPGPRIDCLFQTGNDVVFEGCNVHVIDGSGSTDGTTNGLGNLIVGYDENDGSQTKTGSHNLVVGSNHTYTAFAGFVAGVFNEIAGDYASVLGGARNVASGHWATVSGGSQNEASDGFASVSGGSGNLASGTNSSVSGGVLVEASGSNASASGCLAVEPDFNTAMFEGCDVHVRNGTGSTGGTVNGVGNLIVGYDEYDGSQTRGGSHNLVIGAEHSYTGYGGLVAGVGNTISRGYASVIGGEDNEAKGLGNTVLGGLSNVADGGFASVLGGEGNPASGPYAAVSGGFGNVASENWTSITGGVLNAASAWGASVSGGQSNTASGEESSISGGNSRSATGQYDWSAGGLWQDD